MTDTPAEPIPVEAVADDDLLGRRLHVKHVVPDTKTGEQRISSAAFTDPDLSVDLTRLVAGQDHNVTKAGGAGVAQFAASVPREKQLPVVHKPLVTNPAHSEVGG